MDSITQPVFSSGEVFVPTAPRHDTIDDILISEPAISRIIDEAKSAHQPRGVDWRIYNELKAKLAEHVGWSARRQQLRNSAAWTIAHSALVDALEGGRR